jgi:hypothetical protein
MFGSTLKVWAMVLIVLARVLAGPSAHAMSHDMHMSSSMQEPAAQVESPCPGHSDGGHAPPTHGEHAATSADEKSAHDLVCCKGDACECVCASGAAFLGTASFIALKFVRERESASLPLPPASHRLAALFRPPA